MVKAWERDRYDQAQRISERLQNATDAQVTQIRKQKPIHQQCGTIQAEINRVAGARLATSALADRGFNSSLDSRD